MKLLLLTVLAAIAMYTPVAAQPGSLGVFSDRQGAFCDIQDFATGLCVLFVVHVNAPGVTAAEFSVPLPPCLQMTFISETSPFAMKSGDAVEGSGTTIGYGTCLASPIHVLTLNFYCQGLTGSCCLYCVRPHGEGGGPWVWNCDSPPLVSKMKSTTGVVVNADATCGCLHGGNSCVTVAVSENTWGRLKALYETP